MGTGLSCGVCAQNLYPLTDFYLPWEPWLRSLLIKPRGQRAVSTVDIRELLCLTLIHFSLALKLLAAVGGTDLQSSRTGWHTSCFQRLSKNCSIVWVICIDIPHPVCQASHMSPASQSQCRTRARKRRQVNHTDRDTFMYVKRNKWSQGQDFNRKQIVMWVDIKPLYCRYLFT